MKKTAIALAVLASMAGVAQAQTVSIYGILDVGYVSFENKTAGATTGPASASHLGARDGALTSAHLLGTTTTTDTSSITGLGSQSSSRLGFRGTEDLGGGIKANFVFEVGMNPGASTLTAMNNRQAFAGIEGGFGKINIGTIYTAHHGIAAAFSASTLPNVPGDVMYVGHNTGALNQNLNNLGIRVQGAQLAAAAANAASLAAINAALVTAGVAGAANATGVLMAATTTAIESVQQAANIAQTLIDQRAQATINARLARGNNTSYTVRNNNTLSFESPAFNGITLGAQYSLPTQTKVELGDETTSSAMNFSGRYAAGPIGAAIAFTQADSKSVVNTAVVAAGATSGVTTPLNTITANAAGTANAVSVVTNVAVLAAGATSTVVEVKNTETMAAVSYDLGVAKLSYIYTLRDSRDLISELSDKTTHSVGVKAPFGAVTAFGIYSSGKQTVLGGTANIASFDLTGFQAGVSYALSKRSDIYGIYGNAKMDNKATINDFKETGFAMGLRHSF